MSLTADFAQAIESLGAMASRTSNMQQFMSVMGTYFSDEAKRRIAVLKTTPEFSPWAPWSLRRKKEREEKGNAALGLLYDTGALLESIHSVSGVGGFEVGTDLDYAPDLQNGTAIMPARPFLGWSPDDMVAAEKLALLFIEKGYLI